MNHDTTAPARVPAPGRAQPEQASSSPQRARLVSLCRSSLQSIRIFVRDVGHGLMEVSHNTLALVGLAAVATLIFVAGRADLRHEAEVLALDWLQDRHTERKLAAGNLLAIASEPDAVARATAADPGKLTREQAAVAHWLSRRYRVAPEPLSALVKEAWAVGEQVRLDPTLILAIMAIESRFNPFAQSSVGAQGLMQVMTRVHTDKYESFGGTFAAFDPISNLRVGVQVLKDCIARAGSVYDGLRYYVGAALLSSDGGYAGRVLSEQAYLRAVASGQKVPVNAAHNPPPPPVREATLVETGEEGAEAAAPAPDEAASAPDVLPARVALLEPSR